MTYSYYRNLIETPTIIFSLSCSDSTFTKQLESNLIWSLYQILRQKELCEDGIIQVSLQVIK